MNKKIIYTHFLLSLTLAIGIWSSSECMTDQNKIVYLIANPRASLVEFLRMIGERGDFKVMHIPANWAYCHAHNYTDVAAGWYREDAPTTYEQAKKDILNEATAKQVFVGENTHTAKDFLEQNNDFIRDPRVQFIFLLSHPHTCTISYYEKKKDYFDKLPIHQMTDSIGLKDLYAFTQQLEQLGLPKPLIIKSEDLHANAEETIKAVCNYLNIPFKPEALQWQDISKDFVKFEGWYTIELTDCALHWHTNAIKSTAFSKLPAYAIDQLRRPTFEEITNPVHKEICMKAYEENLVYYELLTK